MTLATVPRYDAERMTDVGHRAVVVGGSVAGLLAARVLADGFEDVMIIERDSLPDQAVARRGVPRVVTSTYWRRLVETRSRTCSPDTARS